MCVLNLVFKILCISFYKTANLIRFQIRIYKTANLIRFFVKTIYYNQLKNHL